jgi:tetratricopeptide (TPR) repeat protein
VIIRRTLLVLTLAAGVAPHAAAQGTAGQLHSARELYASARYDEALAVLDRVRPSESGTPEERRAVEQYRSLCLLALGRASEAEAAIAAVVTADPLYQPSETDASPRVRAAFTEVRHRVLPGIAFSQYAAAKRLYDQKDHAAAVQAFKSVLRLLDDPDMQGQQGDLRVLASGFLELSVAAATPSSPAKADMAPPLAGPAGPPSSADRVYTLAEPGITPAVALKQDLPRVPSAVAAQVRDRGMVEIVIDELGRVTFVSIRSSLHPMYDKLLLSSAREWRYQPAALAGTAVKFRKLIQISLAKR